MSDLDLDVGLQERVAEVGRRFEGAVRRAAHIDDIAKDPRDRVRAVRLSLRYWTEGRGDTDKNTVSTTELPVDEHGAINQTFHLVVPTTGPISYDGRLIRVRWEIEARVDIKLATDPKVTLPVMVVPYGGWSVYTTAHPLPQ